MLDLYENDWGKWAINRIYCKWNLECVKMLLSIAILSNGELLRLLCQLFTSFDEQKWNFNPKNTFCRKAKLNSSK